MLQSEITNFDSLMSHYSTWVIEYHPLNTKQALFLIWYTDTDENSTDKLLSYKTGEIFASHSLKDIKEIILSKEEELAHFDNLSPWLHHFNNFPISFSASFQPAIIMQNISNNILDIPTFENATSFINLFNDFALQDIKNNYLQEFSKHELIQKTWDYFYDYIFWPRFNDKEKFEKWNRLPPSINHKELFKVFEILSIKFEEQILIK